MNQPIRTKLEQRFGNPPRIKIVGVSFKEDPLGENNRSVCIIQAYSSLLRDLLGREPKPEEIFGRIAVPIKQNEVGKILEKEKASVALAF